MSIHLQKVQILFVTRRLKLTRTYRRWARYLRQDIDPLVATPEGQVENGAAPVGHGRRLQLQHQVRAVGLAHRRLGVWLRTHDMERLRYDRVEIKWCSHTHNSFSILSINP